MRVRTFLIIEGRGREFQLALLVKLLLVHLGWRGVRLDFCVLLILVKLIFDELVRNRHRSGRSRARRGTGPDGAGLLRVGDARQFVGGALNRLS